ncbi:MAG: putative 3-hydroxyacyl-CoA dehydrogenase [Alphaproteobacteria bacterium MarineAlpha5_Bin11]|nr:MAG: putative 3-hydroxyacyl-CoA dehydrogenase [Alphaproteobacteria bacterium MarineAlpha5_Bin11]|tara:strand:+ start:5480 stop:7804 length:2325 start_codon:yes stop_codon:yes gene_type:complete
MFNNVTVIGSGLMGSTIAAHLSNAGCNVYLLDIVLKDKKNRNFLADESLKKLLKIKPSPLTLKSNLKYIKTGNIEDNLEVINSSEWVIEAIFEDLNIKKNLYKKIEKIMKNDLIISSNTSTIKLSQLTEGMSLKFANNFLITHFFNPPRYLKLLEIVTSKNLNKDIKDKIIKFCDIRLGKNVIESKDTPGFIGNRIGIYWIERAAVEAIKFNLSVEEADQIIINIFNVPKTGIFGLIDVVGLDLVPYVINSLLSNIPKNDLYHSLHEKPELFDYMIKNNMIGRKGDGGFYKLKITDGEKVKYSLNLKSKKYEKSKKINKIIINFDHYKNLIENDINDKYINYATKILIDVLYYVLIIAEEISLDIYAIDSAMRDGFGWKLGPFEMIDKLGISFLKKHISNTGRKIPNLLNKINDDLFYKVINNELFLYDFKINKYKKLKVPDGILSLSDFKRISKPIKSISTASLWDIGDGITVFEIHSKGNSIDINTMSFLDQSIDIVSANYKAMIIYNEGEFFSAGANLGEALFLGNIGLDEEIYNNIISKGQNVYKKMKYSNFPVIAAPSNIALGGGCEILLHSDFVQAHIESYIGLTEAALGIIPAWGGCKEMLSRFKSDIKSPKGPMPSVLKTFNLIGNAKVSTSAHEAIELGYLKDNDGITMNRNRLLFDAKNKALEMINTYEKPLKNKYFLPGKSGVAALKLTMNNMHSNGLISDHDLKIGNRIAEVISGGNTDFISEVDEEYILKLEKNAIYSLLKENLTIERLEYILETGKYLRN